jgi:adenine-specific DNA methylase
MQPHDNPYQFITDANHKPKKPMLPSGNSKQARILIVAGGVVALLIIGVIVMSLISSAGKGNQETLLKAAKEQAELIRVSKIGIDKARDPATLNLAMTTNLSLQSDQAALLKHVKTSSKELALGKNTKTDIALTTAEQSNRFDEVFTQTIQAELTTYQKTLKSAYDGSSGKTLKATLAEQYTHASILTTKKS